jgi:hypothetical protein
MRVSRMWLTALVVSGFIVGVVVVALITTSSGGDDVQTAAANSTPSAAGKPVKVVIAGTNDALEPNIDGGIQGEGTFRASGAIIDRGPVTAYRAMPNNDLILLRFVSKGKKGTITFAVDIHIAQQPPVSRWKIESATKAYKGLQGKGIESENPPTYTVVYLRGKVWR